MFGLVLSLATVISEYLFFSPDHELEVPLVDSQKLPITIPHIGPSWPLHGEMWILGLWQAFYGKKRVPDGPVSVKIITKDRTLWYGQEFILAGPLLSAFLSTSWSSLTLLDKRN